MITSNHKGDDCAPRGLSDTLYGSAICRRGCMRAPGPTQDASHREDYVIYLSAILPKYNTSAAHIEPLLWYDGLAKICHETYYLSRSVKFARRCLTTLADTNLLMSGSKCSSIITSRLRTLDVRLPPLTHDDGRITRDALINLCLNLLSWLYMISSLLRV